MQADPLLSEPPGKPSDGSWWQPNHLGGSVTLEEKPSENKLLKDYILLLSHQHSMNVSKDQALSVQIPPKHASSTPGFLADNPRSGFQGISLLLCFVSLWVNHRAQPRCPY